MEEKKLDVFGSLLKSLLGEDFDFEVIRVDEDGNKTIIKNKDKQLNLDEQSKCPTTDIDYKELRAAYDAQKKYIAQLTEKLDVYNKKELERSKQIELSKNKYKHLMMDFEKNLVAMIDLFLDLCEELDFENERFYQNLEQDIMNYHNNRCCEC